MLVFTVFLALASHLTWPPMDFAIRLSSLACADASTFLDLSLLLLLASIRSFGEVSSNVMTDSFLYVYIERMYFTDTRAWKKTWQRRVWIRW